MHQVTEKLLNKEIKVTDITLDEFYQGREIYPTYSKAQMQGFEAEHISTVALQIRHYNLEHGTNYTNRDEFRSQTHALDDSCYRLTPFEHIISHLLKALNNEEEAEIFYYMWKFYQKSDSFTDLELITIEDCLEYSKLRELDVEKANKSRFEYYANLSEEERLKRSQKAREIMSNPIVRQKIKDSYHSNPVHSTEEYHKQLSNIHSVAANKPEVRLKNSLAQINYFKSLSDEEYEFLCEHRKEVANRLEVNSKIQQSVLEIMRSEKSILQRSKIKEDYKVAKENNPAITWNEFQKILVFY